MLVPRAADVPCTIAPRGCDIVLTGSRAGIVNVRHRACGVPGRWRGLLQANLDQGVTVPAGFADLLIQDV